PGDNFAWPTFWDHYVDSIFQCNEICKSFGVKLLVEPRIGEIVSNSDGALALAKGIHDDNFGLIFDTAHLYAQKENLALSVAKLHRYIEYIDISDNDGRENRHLVPGQGRIEWDTFFTCLKHYEVDVPLASDLEKLPDVPGSFRATRDFLGNAIRRLAS
ncbi:MAG: sugar phosphate isomerase/epimerase family protein, partial [Candidatus Zixiibacteriota bacterium]